MKRWLSQPTLPGHEPPYVRLDVTQRPDGLRDVRVYATDGPGFVSAADSELYEALTAGEVVDVIDGVLATLLGG